MTRTEESTYAELGLEPPARFAERVAAEAWQRALVETEYLIWRPVQKRPIRCAKCAGDGARAHHHLCPKRGACHYRRGERLRAAEVVLHRVRHHRSGRTTRTLVQALVAVAEGREVVVVAANHREIGRLGGDLRRMGARCGVSVSRVIITSGDRPYVGRAAHLHLADHFTMEATGGSS